jgi:hypothetical protein
MKRVDMEKVDLIHSGESWPHVQSPSSRQMILFLERNESVVTWVQVTCELFVCFDIFLI